MQTLTPSEYDILKKNWVEKGERYVPLFRANLEIYRAVHTRKIAQRY